MGILTLLRNAFGRSRKERAAQTEGATQETAPAVTAPEPKLPSQPAAPAEPDPSEPPAQPEATPQVPEPRSESTPAPAAASTSTSADEHDLVKAAFTNITVPKPTDPEPEPQSEATPEPAAEPQPEAKPDPQPEPKPKTEPQPDPKTETAPEPAAEPQSEAEPAPTPAPAPEPAPDPAPTEGEAEATKATPPEGTAQKPATSAARLRSQAPGLTTAYKAAGAALKKHGLTGTRARVHLVLDRSASMRAYFKDGSAQALAEQTLALAAHLDPEAAVHVTFFSTEVDGTGELTLADHENKIDELHGALGRMGRTAYHAAVEAVLAHHAEHAPPGTPALVVFQTDGAPDAKTPATQSLTDAAANHPNVHFSFVAFGDPENKAFDYLRRLKTGNASHFLAGETPKELTDKELYEGVLATWRP
ncbi:MULTISPECIES: VWA domain-containing protein [Streptomyces]|uniref:VWA domain-containing protein n=1 Tax=Streptomyces TaxID=1883 RepID=UPI00039B293D|nr:MULTISPECIES: VWA domain-containing protein [Streptomyces]MBZ6110777.1 VWA domain-containing protein [Streptomyces olivaceus]MBZ6123204.1 VWA domain-containing protein [Streptomyces olivaceus]MBZ6146722.1 VWA domain-containing protein [Streptomyces olivaceus]MBZ6158482.1 VWA domain-containing protein [Streptomyces olivaceus]MBZ6186781.1 VWA domain-containing protein [Streptomyces olivaceus]